MPQLLREGAVSDEELKRAWTKRENGGIYFQLGIFPVFRVSNAFIQRDPWKNFPRKLSSVLQCFLCQFHYWAETQEPDPVPPAASAARDVFIGFHSTFAADCFRRCAITHAQLIHQKANQPDGMYVCSPRAYTCIFWSRPLLRQRRLQYSC